MSIKHTQQQRSITERQRKLSRTVARKVRVHGIDIRYVSLVDVHGGRLLYWDLQSGDVHVMCRPQGWRLLPGEVAELSSVPHAFLQYGATDTADLVAYCGLHGEAIKRKVALCKACHRDITACVCGTTLP